MNRYKMNRQNRQKILLITYNSSNRKYPKHRYRLKNKPIKLNSRINNNNQLTNKREYRHNNFNK